MSDLINLFKTLTSIDSVSGEEKRISDFVCDYLRNLGLNPIQDSNHMIYCRIGSGENPKLFCAHLDTVEPGRGVVAVEKDGFLVSKGETILGGDNKVSLAVILFSVQKLIQSGRMPNIELLFSVREETNSGIQEIDKTLLTSKLGFIFDYGNEDLGLFVKSAPTIQDFLIEIFGKSAHASRPEEGINTLDLLTTIGNKLKCGRLNFDTTFNIGLISGGSSTNTVPEYIKLQGDLRSNKHETFLEYKEDIEEIFNTYAAETNTQVKFTWIPYAYGYEIQNNEAFVDVLKDIYLKNDLTLKPIITTSGSDAGLLNSIGITSFCLGDGVLGAHTVNERVKIEDFLRLQKIVEDIMVY